MHAMFWFCLVVKRCKNVLRNVHTEFSIFSWLVSLQSVTLLACVSAYLFTLNILYVFTVSYCLWEFLPTVLKIYFVSIACLTIVCHT